MTMKLIILANLFLVLSFAVFLLTVMGIATLRRVQPGTPPLTSGAPARVLADQIIFWQEQIAAKPDFRDAYLQLVVLHWRLGRDFEADKFLKIALTLDPNHKEALKLQGIMGARKTDH